VTDTLYDLETLAGAERLGDWMFDQFAAFVGLHAAEVGPGLGTFTRRLLAHDVQELLLLEPETVAAEAIERRFAHDPRVRLVREELPSAPTLAAAANSLDFVLCQNVLEHIEDEVGAVATMAAALRPGGALGLLVPAHPRLYGSLDHEYGHYRRYTRPHLREVVEAAGLEVVSLRSFNLLGIPGWWLTSRTGRRTLDRRAIAVYEQIVRAWRPLEDLVRPPWGLSLVVVARRPASPHRPSR
jgi:SAM-dependent methyltransferase